ncbi:MAG: sulfite exporter TauE/SafE family protein [Pirellulaceae bacterium]|nr:sulfite exporter TauE/SafE family protein [Pirellulaceae bacterium]HJN13415.1 sulfite exporter TauE/SafE family protein [Pirellulaceae bacterium]
MEPQIILVVVAIVFAGALTRSTFGFGEALVAMPLMSTVVDVKFAATLIALSSTLNAMGILFSDWQGLQWRATKRLAIATLVGVPVGVLGVEYIPEIWIKIVLAFVVIGFAVYNLLKPTLLKLRTDRTAPAFGLVSGVLGGAYVTLGPPLVIFATLRGWEPRQFRSTLQGVFFPASIFVCLNHFWYGRWNSDVFACLLASIPLMAIGLLLGWWLNRRFSTTQFKRCVFALLLASGLVLVTSVVVEATSAHAAVDPIKAAAESPADTQTSLEPADRPVR